MKKLMDALVKMFGLDLRGMSMLSNVAAGTHEGSVTKLADAALTTRYLVVKTGTDADHVAACGANDLPFGVANDEAAAAEDPMSIGLFGCAVRTQLVVASEAIIVGQEIYTAASGKVQNEPAVAGTYYRIGRAVTAAAGDGDVFEMDPYPPTALLVSG